MDKNMKFALLGGDMRHVRLAEQLAADGHKVYVSCLEKAGQISGAETMAPEEILPGADCVLLPLPALDAAGFLNAPLSARKISAEELLLMLPEGKPVYGGRLNRKFLKRAEERGLKIADYFEREENKIAAAAATAEGAVQIAMEETPHLLCGSDALVIGYGRIGRLLSARLKALGANVTASARKASDLAWIKASGFAGVKTAETEKVLPWQDVVFNTVPALVMPGERLALLKKGALCIDLASKPGGIDFEAASELGIRVIWALSLPGEVAPTSAGAAIKDSVYSLLAERGGL